MQYGLLGEKLGHSWSKTIHEQLADYTYDLIPTSKEAFTDFMLKREFKAINVTIPYKEKVIPYLEAMDEQAASIQAVNTIVNRNGNLYGYNTDYDGFLYTLHRHQIDVTNKKVLVLGYGGAAKAVIAVLHDQQVRDLKIVNRTVYPETISYEECITQHQDADIIINTTSVGMYPNLGVSPIDLSIFKQCKTIIDIIYNPLKTKFLIDGESLGMQAINGLEMLVAQAKYAVEHFQDKKIDDQVIDKLYLNIQHDLQNIILIGMPSAGKTTIGKQLGVLLQKEFIDIDQQIVTSTKMSIPDYFAKYGELAFRDLESETCIEFSKKNHHIIATGGGAVLRSENIDALKANGLIIWIRRPLDALIIDGSRPLSSSAEAVSKLYEQRYSFYQEAADIVIDNHGPLKQTIQNILHAIKAK